MGLTFVENKYKLPRKTERRRKAAKEEFGRSHFWRRFWSWCWRTFSAVAGVAAVVVADDTVVVAAAGDAGWGRWRSASRRQLMIVKNRRRKETEKCIFKLIFKRHPVASLLLKLIQIRDGECEQSDSKQRAARLPIGFSDNWLKFLDSHKLCQNQCDQKKIAKCL